MSTTPGMCAAYGCPCVGTASTSGAGTSSWFCTHHLGTDAGSWARITLELKRLEWLLTVSRGIRVWYGTERWERVYRAIQHDILLNQRSDLMFNRETDQSVHGWLLRLEGVISHAARGVAQPQLPIGAQPVTMDKQDPMRRVQFTEPTPT